MPSARITKSITIGGETFSSDTTDTSGEELVVKPGPSQALPAAKVGSLTTRTSGTEGVITSNAHGYTVGTVAVFWNIGGVAGKRYGCTCVYDTNTLTISFGAGDNLPAELSAVTVFNEVAANFAVDGDDMVALVVQCTQIAHCAFMSAVPGVLLAVYISAANGVYEWTYSSGITNPMLGVADVATIKVSHAATAAATMTVGPVFATA